MFHSDFLPILHENSKRVTVASKLVSRNDSGDIRTLLLTDLSAYKVISDFYRSKLSGWASARTSILRPGKKRLISCQISSEKEKNKSIQGKEKLKVDLARLCTEPPVAPPEAAESTDPLGCPFSRGRAAGKFLDPGTREGSIFRVFDSISIAHSVAHFSKTNLFKKTLFKKNLSTNWAFSQPFFCAFP
jgi:hypothetical protein